MGFYTILTLGLCTLCVYFVGAVPIYHSCADLYKENPVHASAPYTIYNHNNQSFMVYCDFHHGYGYTYISPATNVPINIDDLHTGSDHVLIRDLRDDGKQNEAKLEQLSRYGKQPLSIQYNTHTGYNTMINTGMSPYVYVGLLPINGINHLHNAEGYKLNGHDWTFSNCDGNANSYFAFLFNHNKVAPVAYGAVTDSTLLHQWVDRATLLPTSRYMPNNFYSFFEVHMGGCGAYGTAQQFRHVTGAAVGIRYDIMCQTPSDIAHGTKASTGTVFGSTVTYSCDQGYHLLGGDLKRTCSETGQWSGTPPMCGKAICDSQPCQNGGTCFAEADSFICECPDGFSGNQCQNVQ